MTTGDFVRVYPHGSPEKAAIGYVEIVSSNQRGIVMSFVDRPPFVNADEADYYYPYEAEGILFFAYRYEPGPWIEVIGQGHYDIEEEV